LVWSLLTLADNSIAAMVEMLPEAIPADLTDLTILTALIRQTQLFPPE
jgi:hypothetical protein